MFQSYKKNLTMNMLLKYVWTLATAVFCTFGAQAQTQFKDGETLRYKAYFQLGLMTVNGVGLESTVHIKNYEGTPVYEITAHGATEKTMKTLYKLQDTLITNMRCSDLQTLSFYEHDIEHKYTATKSHRYTPTETGLEIAATENRNGDLHSRTFTYDNNRPTDALSILYKIRLYDLDKCKNGDKITYCYFDYGNNTDIVLTYSGKESIKLKNGKNYYCHKLTFSVADGTLFSKKEPVTVWIATGGSRPIVHAEAKLKIGYVKVDLAN